MGVFSELFKSLASGKDEPVLVPQTTPKKHCQAESASELWSAEVDPQLDPKKLNPFNLDVVGESHYQQNLESIVGHRDQGGRRVVELAQFVLEDENPYDAKAVRVDIGGLAVGYLSRENARIYRNGDYPRSCHALIRGGFHKKDGEWASYGVKLDLEL